MDEPSRMALNTRERDSKNDGNEHRHSAKYTDLAHSSQGSRQTANKTNDCSDSTKRDGAQCAITEGVQQFSTDKTMESLDEGIVEDEHDCRCVVYPVGFGEVRAWSEEFLAEITDVLDFWVLETVTP